MAKQVGFVVNLSEDIAISASLANHCTLMDAIHDAFETFTKDRTRNSPAVLGLDTPLNILAA